MRLERERVCSRGRRADSPPQEAPCERCMLRKHRLVEAHVFRCRFWGAWTWAVAVLDNRVRMRDQVASALSSLKGAQHSHTSVSLDRRRQLPRLLFVCPDPVFPAIAGRTAFSLNTREYLLQDNSVMGRDLYRSLRVSDAPL